MTSIREKSYFIFEQKKKQTSSFFGRNRIQRAIRYFLFGNKRIRDLWDCKLRLVRARIACISANFCLTLSADTCKRSHGASDGAIIHDKIHSRWGAARGSCRKCPSFSRKRTPLVARGKTTCCFAEKTTGSGGGRGGEEQGILVDCIISALIAVVYRTFLVSLIAKFPQILNSFFILLLILLIFILILKYTYVCVNYKQLLSNWKNVFINR